MAKFSVAFTVSAEIEVSDEVLALCKDTTRFRPGATERDVAEHIAFNMLKNSLYLEQMDGFADRKNDEARFLGREEWECEALHWIPEKKIQAR